MTLDELDTIEDRCDSVKDLHAPVAQLRPDDQRKLAEFGLWARDVLRELAEKYEDLQTTYQSEKDEWIAETRKLELAAAQSAPRAGARN